MMPLSFGIMNEGVLEPVGEVSDSVGLSSEERYWYSGATRSFEEAAGTLTFNLQGDTEKIRKELFGIDMARPGTELTGLSIGFNRIKVNPYRHDFVWQYKLERKGNKANKHGMRFHTKHRTRTIIPNVKIVRNGEDFGGLKGYSFESCVLDEWEA